MPRLILASGSPRRRQLLAEAGYVFDVIPADIDESAVPSHLAPAAVAEYLAIAKGKVVAERFPGAVVLAADTVVALGATMLGKPTDAVDAKRMLSLLSGTSQQVFTGVAVYANGGVTSRVVTSIVAMRKLSPAEIDTYVATNNWMGKAGGYGIQDDDPFVIRMEGSLTNIVGLPMETTREMLTGVGMRPANA